MTVSNTRLLKRLPDAYEKRRLVDGQRNGNYLLMQGVAAGTEPARVAIEDYENDLTISTATGAGLDRLGARYKLDRPVWMEDARFQALLGAWVAMPMCTLQKIKRIFDLFTGLSCAVNDIVTNPAIPAGEIWLTLPAGYLDMQEMGFYPDVADTIYDGYPTISAVAGETMIGTGFYPAQFNDHVAGISTELKTLLDRVKAAGTTIIYI